MPMSETDFDALGAELDSASSGGNDNSDDDDTLRLYDAPRVKPRPQTIFDAEEIIDLGFTGDFTEEQNLRGGRWQDMGAAVLTLKNPVVVEGDIWVNEGGDDYRVLDMDAEDVSENIEKDGDDYVTNGVSISSSDFDGEQVEEIDAPISDYEDEGSIANADAHAQTGITEDDTVVRLFLGKGTGQHLLRVLDCLGGVSAYYTDPEDENDYDAQTKGLVEFPNDYGTDGYDPNGDDDFPRIARLPTLREDLEGESVRFVMTFRDTGKGFKQHNIHVVSIEEAGQSVDMDTVGERKYHQPDETSDVGEPEMTAYMVWHDIEDSLGSDESVEDATEDIEFSAMDDGSSNTSVTLDDLDDGWMEFINQAHQNGLMTDDFENWEQTVQTAIEDDGLPERDADVIGRLLDEQTEKVSA